MDVPEDHHDQRQTNIVREIIRTPITDARDYEKVFDLDSHGFAFRKSKLEFDHSFDDEEDIEKHYLPGARDILLREVKDADEVFVFDWRIRTADYQPHPVDMSKKTEWLPPATNVHIDQSPLGVLQILKSPSVRDHINEETLSHDMQGRVRIVNLWRPVNGPVRDVPLAICDGKTVEQSDIYTYDVIRSYGYRIRKALAVAHRDTQRWYYLSDHHPDEVTLIKCFDSDDSVPAKCWYLHENDVL